MFTQPKFQHPKFVFSTCNQRFLLELFERPPPPNQHPSNFWKKLNGPETDVPELFRKNFQKVQKSAKRYQSNWDHFQSQQQINEILQPEY